MALNAHRISPQANRGGRDLSNFLVYQTKLQLPNIGRKQLLFFNRHAAPNGYRLIEEFPRAQRSAAQAINAPISTGWCSM